MLVWVPFKPTLFSSLPQGKSLRPDTLTAPTCLVLSKNKGPQHLVHLSLIKSHQVSSSPSSPSCYHQFGINDDKPTVSGQQTHPCSQCSYSNPKSVFVQPSILMGQPNNLPTKILLKPIQNSIRIEENIVARSIIRKIKNPSQFQKYLQCMICGFTHSKLEHIFHIFFWKRLPENKGILEIMFKDPSQMSILKSILPPRNRSKKISTTPFTAIVYIYIYIYISL